MSPHLGLGPAPGARYHAHDTIAETGQSAVVGLGSGLFLASIVNALSKQRVGVTGIFTRGSPIIGFSCVAPATYTFVSRSVMNLRQQEDAWAAAFGGFSAGGVLGLYTRRLPIVLGLGAFVGSVQGTFFMMGNRLGATKDKEQDEFERKEIVRRTTRVPLEQTIAEIGEGRGIQPPGYEERRRERLQEKYGIEVNPVSATIEGSQ